ncbi:MAG: DUF3662 and FHA domain-containing protein [Thermoleophilia bacterium]|nr:DUF3662 and FHA domain-containing protein [Thermoleophilia bacterium]
MSVLRTIEQKIEGLVERTFGRVFRSSLQPVELARKLAREMEDHKTVSVSRVYAPNQYTVYLSPTDRRQFASYESALVTELGSYLEAHARSEGLSLLSPPRIRLETDQDLRTGEFGIACRMMDPVKSSKPANGAPPAPVEGPPPSNEALDAVSGTQVLSPEQARAAGLVFDQVTLVIDGRPLRLTKRVTTMGRSRDCDVVVPDPNVSRVHAEVRHEGLDYVLVDLESTNGVEVNGRRVSRHTLRGGDVITMGTSEIRVERT